MFSSPQVVLTDTSVPPLQLLSQSQTLGTHHSFVIPGIYSLLKRSLAIADLRFASTLDVVGVGSWYMAGSANGYLYTGDQFGGLESG